MSSPIADLIREIEEDCSTPELAARRLRGAALELLDEVNRLEREHPGGQFTQGREWHIARYAEGET